MKNLSFNYFTSTIYANSIQSPISELVWDMWYIPNLRSKERLERVNKQVCVHNAHSSNRGLVEALRVTLP
jgi:hypothetical protein